MPQSGFTPVQTYSSSTPGNVPIAANLTNTTQGAELAINIADGKLFYKDASGNVQVLATKGGVGSSTTTQVLYNSSGLVVGSANMTFDGSTLTTLNSAYTGTLTGGTGIVNLGSGQFYKDASGNVGIGTTAPNNKLEVDGGNVGINLQGNGAPTFLAINNTTNNIGGWGAFSTYPGHILLSCGTNSVNAAGGNGIEFQESVYGAGYGHLISGINVSGAGTALTISGRQNAATWTEFARFDTNGNLLVGTTSQLANGKFGVYNSSAGNGIEARIIGSGTAFSVYTARVDNTANLLHTFFYGNYSTVVGSITTNGTITAYNISSDYRLKENIVPLTGALDKITQLKPSVYNYKSKPEEAIEGFIAHELQAVVPHAVTGEKDAVDAEGNPIYQGVDASFLIPHLVAAIQEQQALITDLQTRLTKAGL